MATSNVSTTTAAETGLRPNAVGLPEVLFQSITMMAPAAAVAFAFFPGILDAGGSFPLAVILALVACVLLALSIGQLAIHLPSAGGFYTYVSRGLGRSLGFLTGWLTIPVYLLFMPVNLLIFGFLAEGFVQSETNGSVDIVWWVWSIALAIVMGLITFLGIRISAWTLVVLGLIEIVSFFLLSLFLLGNAPDGHTIQAFTPALSGEPDLGGWKGVLQGAVFAFTAFIGFESAAPLAEESRDARRNVPRAIFYSALIIGLFFVLTGYAGVAGYGFNHIFPSSPTDTTPTFVTDPNPTPWLTLASNVWGQAGVIIVTLVLLNSTAANTAAGYTALGRIVYAMARAGALPGWLGRLHSRYRTPYMVLVLGGLITIGLAFWVTQAYGPLPGNLTVILAVLTDCVLVAYIAVSLTVIFYYRREHRSDFKVLLHAVIPIVTTLLVAGVLISQFYPAPPPPGNLAGPIAAGWLVLGILWVLVLRARRPAALEAGERLYLEAESPAQAEAPAKE